MPALSKLDRDPLRKHHVLVATNNAFQQRARLRRALWREEQQLPVGLHRGEPLGSLTYLEYGKHTLANFLTETIRSVVRSHVLGPDPTPSSTRTASSQQICALLGGGLGYQEGAFVFLHPAGNVVAGLHRAGAPSVGLLDERHLEIAFSRSRPLIPHGFSIRSGAHMDRPSPDRTNPAPDWDGLRDRDVTMIEAGGAEDRGRPGHVLRQSVLAAGSMSSTQPPVTPLKAAD